MRRQIEFIRVIKDFIGILPFVAAYKPPADDKAVSMGLVFQQTAAKNPNRPAIFFEGRELNWQQFNELANQFAHLLKQQGVNRGDVISLLMENRIEMLAATVGASKIGATVALINTSLRGKPLTHCINITESSKCLLGEELQDAIAEVRSELPLAYYDEAGYIGMASAGNHTEGTQFFITHSPTPHLDGEYTIFGKVIEGMEAVHQMEAGDNILSVAIRY